MCEGMLLFPGPWVNEAGRSPTYTRIRTQAEAYAVKGPKAFQVPLTSKPRLYDNLLEAARSLPVRDRSDLARRRPTPFVP